LPGTLNFVGEFMVLISSYPVSALCTILAAVGVILGAVYMLKFYQKLGLGGGHSKEHPAAVQAKDLGGYELMLTVFLISILVVGGFQTAVFLKGN